METKFNFKSTICTSREQSERLLALGLKKETADMCWTLETTYDGEDVEWFCHIGTFTKEDADIAFYDYIPAWSLHRIISMVYSSRAKKNGLGLAIIEYENPFEDMIRQIEWLIKEGYFNKEYLEE